MRTKRARRCRRVLFQRSTWAVSPVSRAHGCVLLVRDDRLVCCPEVGEAMSLAVSCWNGFPQAQTGLFAAITQRVSDHLSRLATQGNPHPDLLDFFEHTRPEFIEFQRGGSGGSGLSEK